MGSETAWKPYLKLLVSRTIAKDFSMRLAGPDNSKKPEQPKAKTGTPGKIVPPLDSKAVKRHAEIGEVSPPSMPAEHQEALARVSQTSPLCALGISHKQTIYMARIADSRPHRTPNATIAALLRRGLVEKTGDELRLTTAGGALLEGYKRWLTEEARREYGPRVNSVFYYFQDNFWDDWCLSYNADYGSVMKHVIQNDDQIQFC